MMSIEQIISVEVFKTNVSSVREASRLKAALLVHFPKSEINFDLEDCDRVLRMDGSIHIDMVKEVARKMGIEIEEL